MQTWETTHQRSFKAGTASCSVYKFEKYVLTSIWQKNVIVPAWASGYCTSWFALRARLTSTTRTRVLQESRDTAPSRGKLFVKSCSCLCYSTVTSIVLKIWTWTLQEEECCIKDSVGNNVAFVVWSRHQTDNAVDSTSEPPTLGAGCDFVFRYVSYRFLTICSLKSSVHETNRIYIYIHTRSESLISTDTLMGRNCIMCFAETHLSWYPTQHALWPQKDSQFKGLRVFTEKIAPDIYSNVEYTLLPFSIFSDITSLQQFGTLFRMFRSFLPSL